MMKKYLKSLTDLKDNNLYVNIKHGLFLVCYSHAQNHQQHSPLVMVIDDFHKGLSSAESESLTSMVKNFMEHNSEVVCKILCPALWSVSLEEKIRSLKLSDFKLVVKDDPYEVMFDVKKNILKVSKTISIPHDKNKIDKNDHAVKVSKLLDSASKEVLDSNRKIKVLVVDDSKTILTLLNNIFKSDPMIEVVGLVNHPHQAEDYIKKYNPDVMTLDIHMPDMNGVELLKIIYPKYKIPALMITSLNINESQLVLDSLESGAFDYIQKPSMQDMKEVSEIIIEKVKAAAQLKLKSSQAQMVGSESQTVSNHALLPKNAISNSSHLVSKKFLDKYEDKLIVMGASTGGTTALTDVLTKLPAHIPPIVIVQHIPAVFSAAFALRLNQLCPFEVKESEDGDEIKPNRVIVGKGGVQVAIVKNGGKLFIKHTDDPPVNRFKPSVDYLFSATAKLVSKSKDKAEKISGLSIIFTGMGNDGAQGMKELFDAGFSTMAQDEASCVVFGMPKEAIALGGVQEIASLSDIPSKIVHTINKLSHPVDKKKAS